MTQTYKVQVSMNQAHIVESGFVWKQGDFGFNIEIEVLDFDTTGATPQIIFRKSTGAVEATQITRAGNKFTYAIRGTELDTPGPCVCDLKLKDSTTKRVSTASFKYFVIPDTMDGLNQQASSYSDTIEQIVEGFDDDIAELREDITKDQDALEKLENIMTVPELRNGSAGNPGNANAISCNAIFPVGNIKKIFVSVDANKIPLQEGYKYMFSYTAYSVSEGNPSLPSLNPYIITSRDPYGYSLTPYITIELPANTKGCVVWLYMRKTDDSGYYSLRVANTGTDAISIIPLYDTVEVDELKAKLYTQLTREPFAFIGSGGHFTFRDNNVYDVNGRCAFRFTAGNLNVKTPTGNNVSITFDDLINSIPADDTYTDSNNVTWVYLRGGRALVFDSATNTVSTVSINGITPLGDTVYPLLLNWTYQMTGGLLYGRFLYDASNFLTGISVNNVTASHPDVFKKQTFAYIGSIGKFTFYDSNVFDGNGRCAWRTTGSICLKLPDKALIAIPIDDVVNSLTSDDKFIDSLGNKWVYLRAGRALVYNYLTSAFETVTINGITPIATNSYPILMAWSGQMVGGLLYEKFLYDSIATPTVELSRRGINDEEVKVYVDNSRHISHRYNVPAPPVLTLLHFSDIHKDTDALNRIYTDASNLGNKIDDVICTGDIVGNSAEQITSWWKPNILTCIGNHDTASYSEETGYDWTALSMSDRDAYYIAPFESNWDITHTSGTSYYYKDYSTQKIRLIVIDCMLYMSNSTATEASTQSTWLTNLLTDAITNNMHVLIASHAPHGGATPVECSFSKYGETTRPATADCDTPQSVVDIVATAITNGLNFIGYIVGHSHQDDIWDCENNHKQLMYCVTCGVVNYKPQWINSDMYRSTSLDAYNIITIDTTNTLVKIIRGGGADIDNIMRPRKKICFNYSTGELLAEEK